MASVHVTHEFGKTNVIRPEGKSSRDTLVLFAIAGAMVLAHLLTNGRYGFHRDELQVLSDARHLDWGFVPYPPFTPFVERIGLSLFGCRWWGYGCFRSSHRRSWWSLLGLWRESWEEDGSRR